MGLPYNIGHCLPNIYCLLTWCYTTSPHVTKPSRPSPLSLYLHPEVIKYCRRRRRLGSKATKHYAVLILFLLSTLTRLKRRDLRLLLPKTCTHFLVWKKERKVCPVWQDSQPLYVAVTALSVLLVSQNRRMRLGLLLPYQPQTRNKCSVTVLLTAFTLMCIQSCKLTWILPTIHHNNTVLVKVPPQLPVRAVKLGWILVKLDPVIEGVEDHRL